MVLMCVIILSIHLPSLTALGLLNPLLVSLDITHLLLQFLIHMLVHQQLLDLLLLSLPLQLQIINTSHSLVELGRNLVLNRSIIISFYKALPAVTIHLSKKSTLSRVRVI
jgi:hypothetical protein